MMYKIKIERLKKINEDADMSYDRWDDIYEQKIEDLDVNGVIAVVNNLSNTVK